MPNVTPRLTASDPATLFAEDTLSSTPQRLNADIACANADFAGGTPNFRGLLLEDRVTLSGGRRTAVAFNASATVKTVDLINGR